MKGAPAKKYRFWQMRKSAKAKNKYVPTLNELNDLLPQNVWHYSYGSERLSEVSIAFPGKSLETHLPVRHTEAADTEADVRASMVCYLIEKGLLDAKKIG